MVRSVGRSILLCQFGDLGDTLLTVPAIQAVRTAYPDARLIFLGKAEPGRLVTKLGIVDEALSVDKHAFDRVSSIFRPGGVSQLAGLLVTLRRRQIDIVMVFHHLVTRWGAVKFALLTLASGARRRLGVDNGRGWFLTDSVVDRGFGNRHESQYWMDVVGLAGAAGPIELQIPITTADRDRAAELLAKSSTPSHMIAIHPGSGPYGPGRRWPAMQFLAAARMIDESGPLTTVIVGTEAERNEAHEIARSLPRSINLVGETTVGELAAVLEQCALLIASDGGVAHVAAAVGTPTLTVFGPSNDRAWHPLGGQVLASDLPCRPCLYRDFERGKRNGCPSRECLSRVTPRMAADAALELLSEGERAG